MEQGLAMFTLANAVKLMNAADGKPVDSIEAIKANEALKGGYLHTDESAKQKQEWLRTGNRSHGLDNPNGIDSITGLPGGKLPNHVTYSNESPYSIGLKNSQGGEWVKVNDEWSYAPSQVQFDKNSQYMSELLKYLQQEKGNGIGSITLPNGKVVR